MAFVFALFLNFGAVESSVEIVNIPQPGEEFVPPEAEAIEQDESKFPTYYFVLLGAAAVIVVLVFAIQQKAQRRILLPALVLPIALIEATFQIEEYIFRQDRDRAMEYFESAFRKTGTYPTEEEFKSEGPSLRGASWMVNASDDDDFSMFWSRPLSSGFSLCFSAKDDRIWIQD